MSGAGTNIGGDEAVTAADEIAFLRQQLLAKDAQLLAKDAQLRALDAQLLTQDAQVSSFTTVMAANAAAYGRMHDRRPMSLSERLATISGMIHYLERLGDARSSAQSRELDDAILSRSRMIEALQTFREVENDVHTMESASEMFGNSQAKAALLKSLMYALASQNREPSAILQHEMLFMIDLEEERAKVQKENGIYDEDPERALDEYMDQLEAQATKHRSDAASSRAVSSRSVPEPAMSSKRNIAVEAWSSGAKRLRVDSDSLEKECDIIDDDKKMPAKPEVFVLDDSSDIGDDSDSDNDTTVDSSRE